MSAAWKDADCRRPDPYLDWEYRTRPPCEADRDFWCPVHIQVLGSNGDYLPNLGLLQTAVRAGKLDGDPGGPDDFTIRMSDDEYYLLKKLVDSGDQPHDPIEAQFFIYRPESLIYVAGHFASVPIYRALYAGPPIPGINSPSFDRTPFGGRAHFADAGVAIGIVDDGIGFAHERFRTKADTSRFQVIWIQETEQAQSQNLGVSFGSRLTYEQINGYLSKSESEIYRDTGVVDFGGNLYNPLAARASHGTHVLDLAAGRDPAKDDGDDKGPRPIFAVQLPSAATIDTSGTTMGSYVFQAVRMIMVWADQFASDNHILRQPLVINFSYGILAGPKDGSQYLENALCELIDYRNSTDRPTRLVMPAGNSYRQRAAAKVILADGQADSLVWVVLPDDGTPNFIEIWLDGSADAARPSPVEIALTPPGDDLGTPVRLTPGTMRVLMAEGRAIAGMYYDVSLATSRPRVFLAVAPTIRNDQGWALAPSGRWNVAIRNVSGASLTAHLYVQRDDTPFGYPRKGRQSRLDHPNAYCRDPQTGDYRVQAPEPKCPIIYEETLSATATSRSSAIIVVGAAEATDGNPPADYTSSGPIPSRPGPDCSAFADDGDAHWGTLAAGTFSGSFVRMNGTSVAAPQVARRIADDLAGVASKPAVPVPPDDQARLGSSIAPLVDIPARIRRRYPAT